MEGLKGACREAVPCDSLSCLVLPAHSFLWAASQRPSRERHTVEFRVWLVSCEEEADKPSLAKAIQAAVKQ